MAPPKPSSRLKAVSSDEPASPRPIQRPAGLVDEVYNRVRDDIMSLKIAPDTRITIESLARSLGVSQTPIREALSMLEAKGLVTKQHLIGYCTAPILNRAQFENIHEIRLLIEPYAARMAARKMSEESVAELGRLLAKMRPKKDDSRTTYDQFAELDAEFHERIAEATGNPPSGGPPPVRPPPHRSASRATELARSPWTPRGPERMKRGPRRVRCNIARRDRARPL